MKSIIPWVGGKGALLHEILPRFPLNYDTYIEVFGGGGSVLFGRRYGKQEIYNDFQNDLVNLFQVIKERPVAFLKAMNHLPVNAREEYKYIMDIIEGNQTQYIYLDDEVELAKELIEYPELEEILETMHGKAKQFDVNRAVIYYKLIVFSYGSRGKSFGSRPLSLHNLDANIKRASRRLRRVVIENQDFEKLVLAKDHPNSFFYCDPPYFETEGYYDALFSVEDHQRLKNVLSNIQGRFLLSYNDCDYIRELYKDFNIVSVTRLNNLKQRYEAGSEFKELLIANYDIELKRNTQPYQPDLWEVYE